MFSFRTTPLLEQPDLVLKNGNLAILCNQVAWRPDNGEYLFETIARGGKLKRVFMPEHSLYGKISNEVEVVEIGTSIQAEHLKDIDALIVELQDVGGRYGSFTSTLFNLFTIVKQEDIPLSIYLVDRFNPSGRQVEGTIGQNGLPHRHGLTFGEIANLFYNDMNAKFPLHIISANAEQVNKELLAWTIPPFTDFAGLFTSNFYTGQCLWMGTNVSYGHGTTRPFERFGAPYMESLFDYNAKHGFDNWNDPNNPIYCESLYIRWDRFVPAYGIYKDEVCFGFHLMFIPGVEYHSFNHALKLIRFVKDNCSQFKFNGIESYLEDDMLLSYLNGDVDWEVTKEYIKAEEQKWIRKAKKYMLYEEAPWRVKK